MHFHKTFPHPTGACFGAAIGYFVPQLQRNKERRNKNLHLRYGTEQRKAFPFVLIGNSTKMMKQIIFIGFLMFLQTAAWAQPTATISGQILDGETNEPLPYASLVLREGGDSLMRSGTLSDEAGRFVFSGVSKGNFVVECGFVGYQPARFPVLVGEKNNAYDLGKIRLMPQAATLGEVTVEARRAMVEAGLDKKTFDLSEQPALSGGSVLDALRGLPGIRVDQEGKVELRGSDKVAILMDGKQSSLTGFGNQKGLDNIPAANVERIEIINNPSARYDASGMAGIINIIYKKEKKEGWSGDAGLRLGMGQIGRRKPDLPTDLGSFAFNPKIIPSLSLNRWKGAFRTFFQSESLWQERLPNNEFNTRTYDDGRSFASQVPENRKQVQFILKGGLDWSPTKRNTFSASAIFDRERHVDTAQVAYIALPSMQRQRYWHWKEVEVTGYMNYRADFRHEFPEPGHLLRASAQYTRGWEDEEYLLNDSSSVRRSVDTTHLIAIERTSAFQLDYTRPLRSGRLEGGAKAQFRRIPVTYEVGQGNQSVIYEGLGDRSDWGEDIFAAYLNYVWEKERFDLEAGLRAEQVQVSYQLAPENIYYPQNDAYGYFRLYPNVRVSLKINERQRLSAFYNRRVDRPGEPELRIFAKYDDPELLKVGNPYLRPQFTQTFELAYKLAWKEGSAYLAGYHRLTESPFLRVYSVDSSAVGYDIVNRIYQNVGSATNTGFEVLLSHQFTRFWKFNGSVNWYLNVVEAFEGNLLFPTERPFHIEWTADNTWGIKLSNLLTLPYKAQVQLSFLYDAPKNIPQGRLYARSSLDIGIKKSIFKDRGELSFAVTDVFNSYGLRQEVSGEGFQVVYENYYETQVATLGLSYKF